MKDGDVLLLENTRFHKGEEKNDPAFVAQLAKLGDICVNDAFSAAHRAHASTEGLGHCCPPRRPLHAGRAGSLCKRRWAIPKRPVMAVVGGAKVSTKIELLENLVARVETLVIGGAMANTFLPAQGMKRRQVAGREGHGGHRAPHPGQGRGRAAAPSSCRSTPSWPSNSRPMRRPTPIGVDRDRRRRHDAGRRRRSRSSGIKGADRRGRHAGLERARSGRSRCTRLTRAPSRSPNMRRRGPRPASSSRVAGGGDTVAALNAAGVDGTIHICVHRRRRLPGMDGGQGLARRRGFDGIK